MGLAAMKSPDEILCLENERLRVELADARNALQDFVYIVSHDLGAPLRALSGFSEILQKKYGSQFDDKGKTYLQLLHEGGVKAQEMMQGLLLYSRVFSQGSKPQIISLEIPLQHVIDEVRKKIDEQTLRLTVGPLPTCCCDLAQIEQLFSILIENALLYRMPHKPVDVRLAAQDHDTHWLVSVSDNGLGIPCESAKRVFQIFKRLHTAEAYPGHGVGLAVAARIVERHRGEISVQPNPKGGSVFIFTLHKQGPVDPTSVAKENDHA